MRAVDVVRKVAPNAKPAYVSAFDRGDDLLKAAGIDTPLRLSHFLAQVLHESGELTVYFENMNYKTFDVLKRTFGAGHHSAALTDGEVAELLGQPRALAERVYGLGNPKKATELGNTRPGDGYLFRGGGILQTTGGYNYRSMGQKSGVDFYNNPDWVCSAEHALKPALAEWVQGRINDLADKDDLMAISRAINLGNPRSTRMPNGYTKRKGWYERVRPMISRVEFKDSGSVLSFPPSIDPGVFNDTVDEGVLSIQKRLNQLGVAFPPIDEDGDMGPKTVAAIRSFQKSVGLDPDGVVGPKTQAALDAGKVPRKPDDTAKKSGIVAAIVAMVVGIATFAYDHLAFAIVAVAVVAILAVLAWRRR